MRVIGIDIGFKGAIALIDNGHINIIPMPVNKGNKTYLNLPQITDYIFGVNPDLIVIEKVSAMPKQGVVSVFRFGEQFGMIQGICCTLYSPGCLLVRPQEWKKKILEGYPKGDKSASIKYVQEKYPYVSLLPTERSRKPSDGMADAICIAEWGLKYGEL